MASNLMTLIPKRLDQRSNALGLLLHPLSKNRTVLLFESGRDDPRVGKRGPTETRWATVVSHAVSCDETEAYDG